MPSRNRWVQVVGDNSIDDLPTSGMARESPKAIVGNRNSTLLRPLAEAYREKKKLPASNCAASHSLRSDWAIAVLPAPAGPLNHRTLDVREGSSIQLMIYTNNSLAGISDIQKHVGQSHGRCRPRPSMQYLETFSYLK